MFAINKYLFKNVFGTPGAAEMAEKCSAWWLLDAVASHLVANKKIFSDPRLVNLSIWTLRPTKDSGAVLECRADTGEKPAIKQAIPYTDYDFEKHGEAKLYASMLDYDGHAAWLIYLPEEY